MKPNGIDTMPGLARVQPIGDPSASGPGHTPGLTITRKIELNVPTSTPVTAPVVLNRRHVSASSSAGKLALAATAKANPTMNETLSPLPPITATAIETMPIQCAGWASATGHPGPGTRKTRRGDGPYR